MAGSRNQEPPGNGNRFPGPSRTLSGQVPQGERTQQELPQVNMDRHDQGGRGSSRNQIRGNHIRAEAGSQSVGIMDSYNGPSQPGLDISNNTITARERAVRVGINNVGNTTPDNGSCGCCIL